VWKAATPLLPHDDPPGQTKAAATPEPIATERGAAATKKLRHRVSGWVVDQNGNAVPGTNVQIKNSLESAIQEVQSNEDGRLLSGEKIIKTYTVALGRGGLRCKQT